MLNVSSKYFGEKIEVEEVERKKGELTVSIKFEKAIRQNKKYRFSNALSRIGLKTLELKVAMPLLIIMSCLGIAFSGLTKGLIMGIVSGDYPL